MKTLLNARFFTGLVVLAVLASALAIGQPIFASDGEVADHEEDSDAVTITDPDEALRVTAELLAAQEDVTVDQAHGVLLHQERVDQIVAKVVEHDESIYAGVLFEGGFSDPRSTILIRGNVPPQLISSLGELDSDVQIRGGERFSRIEMKQRSDAVYRALRSQGYADVVTGVRHQVINASVRATDLRPQAALDALRAHVEMQLGPTLGALRSGDIILEAKAGPSVELEHSYGGDDEFLSTDTDNRCTSGFSVYSNSSGLSGVLTAQHCTVDRYQPESGSAYGMTFQDDYIGALGDFEWYTTPSHIVYDDFYYAPGPRFDVSSVKPRSQMQTGDWICRWGRASNKGSCHEINDVFVCHGSSGVCDLIRLTSATSVFGDSGGPWYLGTTAWGIHRGKTYGDSLFSIVENAETLLGVTVKR